eukprot:TRINITY_DN515_c0_g1_i1.p1 TRINITY_DN515_c0_g1~~TRINITY_DN515_c0_g1_i1.p1  ORF type:complete len:553 (-),score=222.30 TRINITY_DN515_c0_g1_i1:282-1940(-)
MKKLSSQLYIDGEIESGSDVRNQNVTAIMAVSNIVKSSLGPLGLDKMMVDDIGDITITNDGATILKKLDIEHPASKVLVELANLQDKEVGDGTTSVVILAAELLRRANELIKSVHPTSIIGGYRLASKEACKYIKDNLVTPIEDLNEEALINIAKTSMSSKIIGGEADFFSEMCVKAMKRVKSENKKGKLKYPIRSVNVLKCHGGSMKDSTFVEGYAINCIIGDQSMPKKIENAKIACLDFNLNKYRMKQGVKLTVTDPHAIKEIQKREQDITKEQINKILNSGANVVLTTEGIDTMCMKYFVEAGVMAVRRVDKKDLLQIAKATGATMLLSLANVLNDEDEEEFNETFLGSAGSVSQEWMSDKELIYFRDCKNTRTSSIVLRGPNDYMLDEMERSVHDVLCILKRTFENKNIVAGGGAVEAALSIYLENFAHTIGTREQLAISQFSESLLVIPKVLAVNAAQDASELVAKLRAHHNASQTDETKRHLAFTGLDLTNGKVRNNLEAGVIEPLISKIKAIQFATEAAITILRIDDLIKLNPEPPKEDPHAGHY